MIKNQCTLKAYEKKQSISFIMRLELIPLIYKTISSLSLPIALPMATIN